MRGQFLCFLLLAFLGSLCTSSFNYKLVSLKDLKVQNINQDVPEDIRGIWWVFMNTSDASFITIDLNYIKKDPLQTNKFHVMDAEPGYQTFANNDKGFKTMRFAHYAKLRSTVTHQYPGNADISWALLSGWIPLPISSPSDCKGDVCKRSIGPIWNNQTSWKEYEVLRVIDAEGNRTKYFEQLLDMYGEDDKVYITTN